MISVKKEFDDAAFSKRFSANRAKLLVHFVQAFLASWMSALENTEMAINCVVFFEADVALVAPIIFRLLIISSTQQILMNLPSF